MASAVGVQPYMYSASINPLAEFLEGITLSSDIDGMEEDEDSITLMTLHTAKGLEFPVVFVSGISKKFNESDSGAYSDEFFYNCYGITNEEIEYIKAIIQSPRNQ